MEIPLDEDDRRFRDEVRDFLAREIPPFGGDTLWADMGAAYDCLSDELKARIDGLEAVHDWWNTFGRAMRPEQREALRDLPAGGDD